MLLVGKTSSKYLQTGINEYVERIGHYLSFSIAIIPELKNTKHLSANQQKEQEGILILNHIATGDTVILLDEHGKEYRSIEFSQLLEKKIQTARKLVFVIGGPYGFSREVYQRSNGKLSLSKMTFSHQMARLIFTEQLYRACTILKNEPYHHE